MLDNKKVIAMPGVVVQGNIEPVEDVVELLEEYLEAAKRGEIRGIMVGTINHSEIITTVMEGEASPNNFMLCGFALYEQIREAWTSHATAEQRK